MIILVVQKRKLALYFINSGNIRGNGGGTNEVMDTVDVIRFPFKLISAVIP